MKKICFLPLDGYYAAVRGYNLKNWLCENALVEVFPCIGEKNQCMVGRTWLLAHQGLTSSVDTF